MQSVFCFVMTLFAVAVALPVLVFAVEIASALRFKNEKSLTAAPAHPVAVLIPAYNEGEALLPTLQDVRVQLRQRDRAIVIADNCSDDTAAVARRAGAEVIERNDSSRIGKGYALEFGIRWLDSNPPSIVIVLDADCRLATNAIQALVLAVDQTGRPAQACDLMLTGACSDRVGSKVAELAWRVKNQVRPSGLAGMNMPCQLAGTGMAFPWELIKSAPVASGSLTEDLELGLKMAALGAGAVFCSSAVVWSSFPETETGGRRQRERWELGHFRTIGELFVPTLAAGFRSRNLGAAVLALDLCVPPLSFLAFLVAAELLANAVLAFAGICFLPFWISCGSFAILSAAIWLSWLIAGRDIVPAPQLWLLPAYAISKLGLYRRVCLGRIDARWIRADRSKV